MSKKHHDIAVDRRRIVHQHDGTAKNGTIVYWMDRDQRASDNWALLYAQELALSQGQTVIVVFSWASFVEHASPRQQHFALAGLRETADTLRSHNIKFVLLEDVIEDALPAFVKQVGASAVVADFCPLRHSRKRRDRVRNALAIPFSEVDAHNIVPIHVASDKLEYAARTIRPKIHRCLDSFLTDFPSLEKMRDAYPGDLAKTDWQRFANGIAGDAIDFDGAPGESAALKRMRLFLKKGLKGYADRRNDPSQDGQSNMSPYLHFGQIAPQRLAYETMHLDAAGKDSEAYIEELVVRRELSDNFCYYCPDYDSMNCFRGWARTTLEEHRGDPREYLYDYDTLERGDSHDDLWNAAQLEMVATGKMHGYMRMYWAKKILEWTPDVATALDYAIRLNDRYELDGHDPNGYTGIAWSIGGVHDRAWNEREIFGKIRYMSYTGCKRKFDIGAYIDQTGQYEMELS